MKNRLFTFLIILINFSSSSIAEATDYRLDCPFPCLDWSRAYQAAENIVWFRVEYVDYNAEAGANETAVRANVIAICQYVLDGFLASKLTISGQELAILGPVGLLKPKRDYIAAVDRFDDATFRLITPPVPAKTRDWRDLTNCGVASYPAHKNSLVGTQALAKTGEVNLVKSYAEKCGNMARKATSKTCPSVVGSACPGGFWRNSSWMNNNEQLVLWGSIDSVKKVVPFLDRSSKQVGYQPGPNVQAKFRQKCQLGGTPTTETIQSHDIELSSSVCYDLPAMEKSYSAMTINAGHNYVVFLGSNSLLTRRPVPADNFKVVVEIARCCLKLSKAELIASLAYCFPRLSRKLFAEPNASCDCQAVVKATSERRFAEFDSRLHQHNEAPPRQQHFGGFYLSMQATAGIVAGAVVVFVALIAVTIVLVIRRARRKHRPWAIQRFIADPTAPNQLEQSNAPTEAVNYYVDNTNSDLVVVSGADSANRYQRLVEDRQQQPFDQHP